MRIGSLFVPTLARRQRTLTEMIRLELALLRIEKETGKILVWEGILMSDWLLYGSRTT